MDPAVAIADLRNEILDRGYTQQAGGPGQWRVARESTVMSVQGFELFNELLDRGYTRNEIHKMVDYARGMMEIGSVKVAEIAKITHTAYLKLSRGEPFYLSQATDHELTYAMAFNRMSEGTYQMVCGLYRLGDNQTICTDCKYDQAICMCSREPREFKSSVAFSLACLVLDRGICR